MIINNHNKLEQIFDIKWFFYSKQFFPVDNRTDLRDKQQKNSLHLTTCQAPGNCQHLSLSLFLPGVVISN